MCDPRSIFYCYLSSNNLDQIGDSNPDLCDAEVKLVVVILADDKSVDTGYRSFFSMLQDIPEVDRALSYSCDVQAFVIQA